MLPPRSGTKDPVRVCLACATTLRPFQAGYAQQNANCHKTNILSQSRTFAPASIKPHMNNPFTLTLGSAIRNATYTLMQQMDPLVIPDKKIPASLLKQAEGFMFLDYVRLAFLSGARFGSGLVVVKREEALGVRHLL